MQKPDEKSEGSYLIVILLVLLLAFVFFGRGILASMGIHLDHNTFMVVFMMLSSFIIGYYAMSILTDRNLTDNINKKYQALLMALTMGAVEVIGMMAATGEAPKSMLALAGILIFLAVVVVYMIRQQVGVYDEQFLLSMIEHHQMAIAMSQRILERSTNPDVRQLAENIINAQKDEIVRMREMINKIYRDASISAL